MPSLSPKERKHWQDQLLFADRVWAKYGLLDMPTQSDPMAPGVRKASEYRNAYRGVQPMIFDAVPMDEHFTGNLVFSTINTMISLLSGRMPEVELEPKGETLAGPDAERRARLNEILLTQHLQEMDYKQQVDRAFQSALLEFWGLVQHGYTPSIEEVVDDNGNLFARFKNHRPDFPWIQFKRSWEVRIDPLADSFIPNESARWVAFYTRITESEKRKSPRWIDRKNWKPTATMDLERQQGRYRTNSDTPEAAMLYEVWEIWDREEGKVFALSPGCDQTVSDPRDWPIQWGQLPYSLLQFNPLYDSPFGVSFPQAFSDEQRLYNQVMTILAASVGRTMRKIIGNRNSFSEDERKNLEDPAGYTEFIWSEGSPETSVKEINFGAIDPQLPGLAAFLEDRIFRILGLARMDAGQRINVETAAEAGAVAQGAALNRSRNANPFEQFWIDIIRVTHRAVMQTEDPRRFTLPIFGMANAGFLTTEERNAGSITASIRDLEGEFNYGVRLGSTIVDPDLDLRRGIAVYQALGGDKATVWDQLKWAQFMLDKADLNPNLAMTSEAIRQPEMQQPSAEQQAGSSASNTGLVSQLQAAGGRR